ncbi:MAG TPA: hypothetical protein ENN35_07785 [Deltaproteobacteria bacterium]|nr:hypothetical protein [Deltaproteobacteria bacterium]
MEEHEAQLSTLFDVEDFDAVIEEVRTIASTVFPGYDLEPFDNACDDVVRLFRGDYPGYRACNVSYHDLRHTLAVTLAMARLMHGAVETGRELSEKDFTMGLVSALMHDTGYMQEDDDLEGTGAKYTLVHIERSIDFVRRYYADDPLFGNDLDAFRDILRCTGLSVSIGDIRFADETVELLGKILGTGDLLGQMADRVYLEKLLDLYNEFVEGGINQFSNRLDLLDKTRGFYQMTLKRFADDFDNVDRFARHHFRARWDIDEDLYRKAIEHNLAYLDFVVTNHRDDYRDWLRRTIHVKEINNATGKSAEAFF